MHGPTVWMRCFQFVLLAKRKEAPRPCKRFVEQGVRERMVHDIHKPDLPAGIHDLLCDFHSCILVRSILPRGEINHGDLQRRYVAIGDFGGHFGHETLREAVTSSLSRGNKRRILIT